MKKRMLVLGVLGLGSLALPVAVFAEEANPTVELSSQASLTIQAGNLSLDTVSSFNFGAKSIAEVSQSGEPVKTQDTQTTSVSDFRGPNTVGWQLTAKLSKLETTDQKQLANAKMTLIGTETEGDSTLNASANLVAGATDPTVIATANGTTGLAINTIDFSQTTLTIPKQNVSGGEYKGTITWILTNSYQAD
ncbi:WxL domain-containing protein [Enterococcus sp.]|uniref:WxL domain-containing protein n=1 Tax=Enterococcus sp. TaxID=35783 RepID=UPI0025C0FC35|nr:WxL domain-containing protein [Enterococcus sp.]